MRRSQASRSGLTPADVVVVFFVVLVVLLFVIMGLTRARESARLAMCQNNLAQIGKALAYYDDAYAGLPAVGVPVAIDSPIDGAPPGPLRAMLETLGVASFLGLDPDGSNLPALRAPTPEAIPVAGFLCPSDGRAMAGLFPSPVSYRAATGGDPRGSDGPFAIGRRTTLAEVERRDGTSFTAAFAERLIGNDRPVDAPENYVVAEHWFDRPIGRVTVQAPQPLDYRGDAGMTWRPADFRYTLYNHTSPPASPFSGVSPDGRSAAMGASSAHVRGVNMLMLDGSAKLVAPTISHEVWQAYGTIGPQTSTPSESDPPQAPRN
ncbi:DUF1559 family PulG-like putative transporter [Paludisphaera soli]|uniref:DUF1559 family PulG-like putative transporter n=1 Tax=Paludisphaera soli TaxID=2712865 RepID=UPI0013EB87F2|nr:DUF1559 domain-containing protein [Paludisphaera soli]